MSYSLENRIALVTGASKGIGAAVAKQYAKLGAHVILVARSVKELEAIDDEIQKQNGKATLVPLDLLDLDKIDQLAVTIAERFGKLDILVGNAGMLGGLRPINHITNVIWQKTMDLNVTANFRLIRALHPLLEKSDAGRAIFVTSGITQGAHPFWGVYATSKAALETLIHTYAAENANTSMRINLLEPGIVGTDMRAQAMPGENPETLPTPESITEVFAMLAAPLLQTSWGMYFG